MDKVKKEFMSPASLRVCFYLFVLLLLATPAAYIYDYNGFDLSTLRDSLFNLAVFYTLALTAYIEIRRTKSSDNKPLAHYLIPISHFVLFILVALLVLTALDYINGDLKLDQVYDPVMQLFFIYLLGKHTQSIKQGIGTQNNGLI